ncbi:hypothetical protein, conserved [Eimeria acervulina]|uniref:CDK5 regulatory subunit-associated protein 3 n=1 Tax=Eimeria acervulina TaxID=5801 RepID=U6GXC4_EIMAC|nr:hypothetical protein, conserved [Eimeria acervulina]CDI83908.1 hypothetical protein, conserved [Eimeria acervulina]
MEEVADVPYEGVVAWLLCRRLLPEDYHQRLKGITAHINEALQKPPESRQASLFVSERKDIRFGYREVETLVELLAKEGSTEGILSKAFGSAVYRQWRRLQRTFQQQNLHLADLSRALSHAANVLVPTHQKTMQQKQRLLSDCIAKQQQLQQAAAAAQDVYQSLCADYGLDESTAANDFLLQQQLLAYVHRKLPLRLQQAEKLLQTPGKDILIFYQSFVNQTMCRDEDKMLPLLHLLSEKGNILLQDAAAAAPHIQLLLQQQQQQQQQQQDAAIAEIEIQQQGNEEDAQSPKETAAEEAVCWVVEEGSSSSSSSSSDSNSSSSSSSSSITQTLLGNDAVRRQLLLELMEVRGFLYTRLLQSSAANSSSKQRKQQQQQQQQWQETTYLPEELQISEQSLLSWQECVVKLQDLLGGPETLQLLQLLRSELALNRLCSEVGAARAATRKPLSAAKDQQRRQASLDNEVAAAASALEKQRRELQQLQQLLQERMSSALSLKVRITGIPRERLP